LRGYAQRDPLNEFKSEAFTLFEALLTDLRRGVTRMLMRGQFVIEPPQGARSSEPEMFEGAPRPQPVAAPMSSLPQQQASDSPEAMPSDPAWADTPRNAPCPCGSGKRYKNCHGDVTAIARA
jgi:preprotein translocase subunit SecA